MNFGDLSLSKFPSNSLILFGGRTRTRTWDPLIKSQLLYQLSYAPGIPPRSPARAASCSKATLSREGPNGVAYPPSPGPPPRRPCASAGWDWRFVQGNCDARDAATILLRAAPQRDALLPKNDW